MLPDLTIQNYRTFKDFQIDGLARVNLIVGNNNSGKTSLLEAVYLLVNQGRIQCLIDLLHNRGEIVEQSISIVTGENQRPANGYQIRHIFYGHQLNFDQTISLESQKRHPLSLQIQVNQPPQVKHPFPSEVPSYFTSEGMGISPSGFLLLFLYGQDIKMPITVRDDGLITEQSFQLIKQYQPNFSVTSNNPSHFFTSSNPSLFLTTSNLSFEQLAVFWDGITLTPKEENVVAALQILDPNVERLSFTSRQTANSGILLKVRGQRDPIPLGSMGEGMSRILSLAMASVTVENGVLLVDEIETGLYYQSQTDMWRLILEIAQRLNVQVFATTHSWDCVSAFQEALAKSEDSSIGKLFRLSRRNDNIRPVAYTAEELAIAVRQSIEVR